VQRLVERIERETEKEQGRKLLTSAYILSGLRVPRTVARQVFRGVEAMRDSDTFMAILEEGEEKGLVKEAKVIILRQGKQRFGVPDEAISTQLSAISDLERLHRLVDRMFAATSWQDLLDTP
jgi:hypothetical protein